MKQAGPLPLMQHLIERVDGVVDGDPVHKGQQRPWFYYGPGRRIWVGKSTSRLSGGHSAVLAEALSALVGRYIGVLIPDAAVVHRPAEVIWLSQFVAHAADWSAKAPGGVRDLVALQAMFVLDTIVGNADRNNGNILFEPATGALWAIDHEQAEIRYPSTMRLNRNWLPDLSNYARPFPRAILGSPPFLGAQKAAEIDRDTVRAWVEEAMAAAALEDEETAATLTSVLYQRCKDAPTLVEHCLQRLPGK